MKIFFCKTLLLGSAALLLNGCDSVRNTLGLDHYQADEFNINENPPLSIPPNYNLRPPLKDGEVDTSPKANKETNTSQKAKEALLGSSKKTTDTPSSNARSVAKKATEIQKPDPLIRETIKKEEANDPDSVSGKLSNALDTISKNFANTSNDETNTSPNSSSETQKSHENMNP